MPNSEPTKVSISPKAISTELSIMPVGGTIKPAMSNPAPSTISTTAEMSCNLLSIRFKIYCECEK